jgi:hypothetical protein
MYISYIVHLYTKRGKILLLHNASLQSGNYPQLLASLAYLRELVVHFSAKPNNEPHLPPFCELSEQKEKGFYPVSCITSYI